MKIDTHSVYLGLGIIGAIAGFLGVWRRRFARIFAASLAGFLVFELFCLVVSTDFLRFPWWAVHMPSAIVLGADEILERHGKVVSTVFHLADFFVWSALFIGAVLLWERARRYDK